MSFWNALSVLAPVAPAMSDAQDIRTQREQEQEQFTSEQALNQAQLTAQRLAAQAEQQRITQSNQPVTIGEPQWNPATHSSQILTFDRNTGSFALKDVPGVDPQAAAEARYQAARTDYKKIANRDLTPAEDQSLFFQSYGLKPSTELPRVIHTPNGDYTLGQDEQGNTVGVPIMTSGGNAVGGEPTLSADEAGRLNLTFARQLKAQGLPQNYFTPGMTRADATQLKGALTSAISESNTERRLNMALENLGGGPTQGNPNTSGNAYLASLPAAERSLVQSIGTGKIGLERLGYILARNKNLAAEVSQAYPDFDSSKIQSYIAQYHNFTSGKAAEQLKAGANAIQHLYQLKAINDANPVEVHNAASKAYKQYQAILNVVTGELSKFYATPQTNENREQLRAPLDGWVNRDAGILGQAEAMGVAFNDLQNQWLQAAPSSAYQASLPGLNAPALAALQTLAPDQYQTFTGGRSPLPAAMPAPNAAPSTDPVDQFLLSVPGGNNAAPR